MNTNSIFLFTTYIALFFFCIYLLFKIKPIRNSILSSQKGTKEYFMQAFVILFFSLLVMGASHESFFGFKLGEAVVNLRTGITVTATVLLSSTSGIIVGFIGAVYRYSLGGWTAVPCSIATFFSGVVVALIVYAYRKRNNGVRLSYKLIFIASIFAAIWEVVHVMVLVPLLGETDAGEAFSIYGK